MTDQEHEIKLWLRLDLQGAWKVALSIPVDKCRSFALNPLKWLRYVGFAIYGRIGHLSTVAAGDEIDDYCADIPADNYFYVSTEAPRLVDSRVVEGRTVNTDTDPPTLSSAMEEFIQDLIDRDGRCVITADTADSCDPCHMVPHSKGDDYIEHLVDQRGGVYNPSSALDGINDVRNGLLFTLTIQRKLVQSHLAFLRTPNFAMGVHDVPYHPTLEGNAMSTKARITMQYVVDEGEIGPFLPPAAPHNSDARLPPETHEWPSSLILDFVYGGCAMRAWGRDDFIRGVNEVAGPVYYSTNPGNCEPADEDHTGGKDKNPRNRKVTKCTDRDKRLLERNKKKGWEARSLSDMLDVILSLHMPSKKEQECRQKAAREAQVAASRAKVENWRGSVGSVDDPAYDWSET